MATKRTRPLREYERAIDAGNRVSVRFTKHLRGGCLSHISIDLTPREQDVWDSPLCNLPYRRCVVSIAKELSYDYGVEVLLRRGKRGRTEPRLLKIINSKVSPARDPVARESVGIIEAQRLIESIGDLIGEPIVSHRARLYAVKRDALAKYLTRLLYGKR